MTTFKGSSLDFVNHWLDQLRIYNEISPLAEKIQDAFAMTMLKAAVSLQPELYTVQNTDDYERVKSGAGIDFEMYKTLLMSTCMTFDATHKLSSKPAASTTLEAPKDTRKVTLHDLLQANEHDLSESYENGVDDTPFSLDTPSDDLMINATRRDAPRRGPQYRRPRTPGLNKETWDKLLKADQETWDRLSPEAKTVIVTFAKKLAASANDSTTPSKPTSQSTSRSANITETMVGDSQGEQDSNFSVIDEIERLVNEVSTESSTDRLVNVARSNINDVHPGDIRRVLSNQSKAGTSKSRTISAHAITYNVSKLDGAASRGPLQKRLIVLSRGTFRTIPLLRILPSGTHSSGRWNRRPRPIDAS